MSESLNRKQNNERERKRNKTGQPITRSLIDKSSRFDTHLTRMVCELRASAYVRKFYVRTNPIKLFISSKCVLIRFLFIFLFLIF